MRILVLCDRYPYPLENGQNLRIFHYVKHLRDRHAFDLVCYGDTSPPEELKPLFRSIRAFPRPRGVRPTGLSRIAKAFDVEEFFPKSADVIRHLTDGPATHRWDLVWISGWDMVVNVPRAFSVPVLMDAVDDGVLEHWRELFRAGSVPRLLRVIKRLLMNYRFERAYFAGRDACLFVSELDAAWFKKVSRDTPTFAVHNGVDVEYFKPSPAAGSDGSIVFEGNLSFPPNVDAAVHLVSNVLPRVHAELPEARVTLLGKDPAPAVASLRGRNVEVTGFVPDVRPYLEAAAVFACPMRKGAGIKNKVLQAWAMGKAVVATSIATGGLMAVDGRNILVRDDPEEFARALIALLRDPARRNALGLEARRTAERWYTWEGQSKLLEQVMNAVVSGEARAAA